MALAAIVPGKIAPRHMLVDVNNLQRAFYNIGARKRVEFGTSGHRGSSLDGSFNEAHIAAITQAICEYRAKENITGPLFLGFDTHVLSMPAFETALEVLVANGVEVVIHKNDEFTPTPVVSHRIREFNFEQSKRFSDGIVITPSHNGPADGGFKYNPSHGGPADVDTTKWIEARANSLINNNLNEVKRTPYKRARASNLIHEEDFIRPYEIGRAHV